MADRPFLSRWARLKQESRQSGGRQTGGRGSAAPVLEEPTRQAALPPEAGDQDHSVPARQPQPGQERVREQDAAVDPSELPDIDSLTAESDFTAFMRKGVPKSLQRRALRKLWASDPIFAFQDGLTDYQDDYTDAATVVEGMKSAYQVGRGFLTDAELAENHSVYNASRQARIVADEAEAVEKAAAAKAGMPAEPGPSADEPAPEESGLAEAAQPAETAAAEDETSPQEESGAPDAKRGVDDRS